MDKGICMVTVAPVRAENSDKAEIVTEILFGESADILEVNKNWTRIRMHYDGYEGWMDTKQIRPVQEEELARRKVTLITEDFASVMMKDGKTLLSMGSEVEFPAVASRRSHDLRESIALTAREFLNVPYLWGGKSFFAVDCSGFTQLVYKIHEVKLPRDTSQQVEVGESLTFVEESRPGDLAFFENAEGKIIHVGIMLENQKIIHASGKVRIDTLDSTGIFNKELNKHTHKLRVIKNVL
ncbi:MULTISPECIES: C40 family peptidase [Chryseobacterium]|uniref:Cell wall-associated NlpC family hydrolase n=1 Tax=Chryseobacterium camelliae TaxID=1265445 RepID=A0ABU0TL80_9FLAO|nr:MULTISPECIES: C40 family peptidase [Chryseobacterium]MDT3408351.1 cell wall-associated NlpC family hydrolase [Pseudacidovorax intermedius]MDQ1097792.1 cell wall-associated NlpC family hydrolase [Chryseobacterium camelliae]MDQ1101724.1 cell wall-associated NlpC family hydrolase [Chryseobacterium sp. SORGH_AS_1048]MDR6085163.1 cell wall-associated NlpC family hydrolase [Chryseobacterium sp. SORGH_AS_0909]MDR6129521.1 cell wall-associated NlpC family hydrolase [Chryseobacterium sp. SORGH_AS_11